MNCTSAHDLISAELDGELSADEHRLLTAHLAGCQACTAYAAHAATLQRSMRMHTMPVVPDLVPAVLRSAKPPPMFPLFVRYALTVLALVGLVAALPDLWDGSMNDHAHSTRHLGGWAIAFSIGLIVAAVQPARARGLLPMAGALGGVMLASALFDIAGGHAPGMPGWAHVLVIVQLVLLWVLARQHPQGWTPMRWRRRSPGTAPSTAATPALHVVPPARFARPVPARAERRPAA